MQPRVQQCRGKGGWCMDSKKPTSITHKYTPRQQYALPSTLLLQYITAVSLSLMTCTLVTSIDQLHAFPAGGQQPETVEKGGVAKGGASWDTQAFARAIGRAIAWHETCLVVDLVGLCESGSALVSSPAYSSALGQSLPANSGTAVIVSELIPVCLLPFYLCTPIFKLNWK